jgi:hypothetical protein
MHRKGHVEVIGSPAPASPPYPDVDVAEDAHLGLLERARAAREAAAEARAYSQALRYVLEESRGRLFTSRCAWCGRYEVGDRWVAVRAPSVAGETRTTHTICDDCATSLREAGLSAPRALSGSAFT